MSSIDQRIVEMQFDNQQFESGVKTTISTLDRLKQKLNFGKSAQSLDDLSKASKRFSLEGLASSVENIASKFSFMGVMGVTAMQRISNAAITTGKRLVSALTIDPIRSGLSEYETQIGAIQTILSNTRSKGTTLDQVNNALDELNKYADKTIYNFTEMTRNIGTFTAAGVDLETSVAAIKGISNLAAVSGSTPVQAATAMYQLSQALAAGTIRLMDWNSIVNAGMGGDVLQSALKETARVHGIAIDQMIEEQGSFRETLQKGWLTSEIMLETLQKFTGDLSKEQILAMGYTAEQAEEIIALGKDANDAATKVKTFTQLIDTLKEALGSGWTQTWEYIIGDFEEARTLWTGVSDAIGEIINDSAEARNSMVKAWKEAGGREDLIEGLTDIFSSLWSVVVAVGDAMDDIFPPATVDTLLNISSAVKNLGDNLQQLLGIKYKGTLYTGEDITVTETVGGVDFFGDNLSRGARNDAVKKLQQYLKDAGYDLGNAGVDGIFGPMTEAALKEFQESAGLVVDGIYNEDTHNSLMEALGLGPKEITTVEKGTKVVNFFSDALQRIRNIAKGAFAGLHILWQVFGFLFEVGKRVLYTFSPIGDMFVTIAEAIGGFLVSVDKALSNGTKFQDWLTDIDSFLEPIHDAVSAACDAILEFLGLGDGIENIDFDKVLSDLVTKVRGFFDSIKNWIKNIFGGGEDNTLSEAVTDQLGVDKLGEDIDFKDAFDTIKEKVLGFFKSVGSWLNGVGKSEGTEMAKEVENSLDGIDVMATALTIVTGILGAGVLSAIHQITSVARNAKKFVKSLREIAEGIEDGTLFGRQKDSIPEGILKVAAAIGILAAAVWLLSRLDLAQLGTGLLGLVVVCGILVGTIVALKAVSKGFTGMEKILSTIMSLGIAIAIMAGVVYALGQLDIKQLGVGLLGTIAIMGVAIGALILLSKHTSKADGIEKVVGLIISLAGAISAMSAVVTTLGALDMTTLLKGLAGLGAILVMLSVMMKSMTKTKPNVASVLALIPIVIAVGLMVLEFAALALLMKALTVGDLIKTFASLGAILLTMAAMLKMASKIKPNPSAILSLIPIAIALDLVIVGFIGLALTMKSLTTADLIESIAGLAAVMLSIFGLMKLISGIKPSVGSILSLIPVALALDMVIAGFIGMALTMKGLTTADLIESVVGLGAVMLAIFALMKLVSKIKPSIGAIVSLIPIALALDMVIVGFIGLAFTMRSMTAGDLAKTIVGLGAVMLAIFALMKLVSKIKPSIGSILALIPVALALDLLIAGFVGLAMTMQKTTAGDLAKSIIGLGAVMLAVFGLLKLVSKIKPSIGSILALIPVALALDLLIAGFVGLTLTMKGVTVGTLIKSIVGLGAVMLAIFGLTKLVEKIKVNPKALASLIPVAAAIDLVIAGFIGLLLAMKGASVGAIIGTIVGVATIIGALALFMKSLEKVKPNIRAILSLIPIVIAIDLLLLGFGTFVYALRNVDTGKIAVALIGFGVVMLAMSTFMKSVQGLSFKSSIASLVQCIGLIGIVIAFAAALNSIKEVNADKIISFTVGIGAALVGFGIFTKLAGSIGISGIGKSLLAILGFVAVIAAFGLVMNAIKDVDPSVMISFAESLALGLAALTAACLVAGKLGGVATMASGAAGIGVAISIIVAIGVALVAALGAIDELTKGGLTKLLDSGAKVLESFGKAIGALVGGFVSGFIGPVGEALESLSNGLEGLGSNDNLDEDIDKAIEAVKSIGEFITTIQGMDVERNPGFLFKFYIGDNKTNSLLSQIEQFGVALGEVAGALQGLEGLDATDIQFAIDAVNSIGTFVTTIKDKDVEVEPGLFKKFFGDETKTMSLLDQIKEFGTAMDKIGNYVLWYKNNGIDDTDSDNMITIATKITDFIATIRANYPEDGAGVPDDLFNPYYSDLMTQVEEFGKAMGEVKNGIAGVGEGGENELTDDDIETAEKAVEHISEWIEELDEKLDSLGDVKLSSGWFDKLFNGDDPLTSLFTQIENFATSVGSVKTNLAGIEELDDDDINKATTAAQSIADFITGVIDSEEFQNASSYITPDGGDGFTAIEDLFGRFKTFSETMSTVATGLSGMGDSEFDADNNAAIEVAKELATFFAETLPTKIENMEPAKGVLQEWLGGESNTDAFLTRINEFSTSMSEIIGAFNGMSGTTLKSDMGDATDAIDDIVEMLVNMGSAENSEAINRLIGTSGTALPDAVYGYITGLGSAMDVVNTAVDNVNFDSIEKISEFLNSVNGLVTGSQGFVNMLDAFESLQSTMSGEDENAIDTSTWLSGLNSEEVITRLTDFTTAVNGALTTNTETLSAQVDAFTSAGSELASAVSGGLGSDVDTTGVSNLCSTLVSAIRGYKSDFYSAGWYLSSGVSQGISGGGGIVRDAARRIISSALSAMRAEADEASPSKETEKIARFMDMGLVNGLEGYSHIVSRAAEGVAGEALDSTRNTLANLSTVLSEDMDTTPVIRPVMDMSNISSGAKAINGIFSGGRTLSVGVTAAKAQAASAAMRESRKRQNGIENVGSNVSNTSDSSVNLTGNNFYVRSDQDVRALASEIAALTRQQQRSYGAAY